MNDLTRSSGRSPVKSLGRRALAVVILVGVAYLLLKVVIGIVTAVAGTVVIVIAVIAAIWAIRVLR
ncbi:MAG: hypothetical protein QOI98_647 [Solirubrobacteraceae bacterium]|jgi:hypothetical protein|nr:hypothetical protein [Solirubrobacteraceae bacterium]